MRYVIREKFFRLTEDSDITDESGQPVFQVQGKFLSMHHTLVMRDMQGAEVATIRQHLVALTPTFEITRGATELAEVRKHMLSFFGDRFTIDVEGTTDDIEVQGNLFEHEYTMSRGGRVVATVSRSWMSLSATYGVEVAEGEDTVLLLASVLVLDLTEDEEKN